MPEPTDTPATWPDDPAVTTLLDALNSAPDNVRGWVLAVSGGHDSSLLLELAARVLRPLRVVHVHHGLDAAADAWAVGVTRHAERLGLPVAVRHVQVQAGGAGPEAAAREARHTALQDDLGAGEVLLMAHHQDDQVETVLLRLLRGTGPAGLAGMVSVRAFGVGRLWRPWLEQPRAVLRQAAAALGLTGVDDPSNADAAFDRSWLRSEILPRIDARFPGYRDTVTRAAALAGDLESAVVQEALLDLAAGAPLPLRRLARAGSARGALLRRWLAAAGLRVPSRARLDELLRQLDRGDTAAVRIDGVELRRYRDHLHLVRAAPPSAALDLRMRAPGLIEVPGGRLCLTAAVGAGLSQARCGAEFRLRWRRDGERCRPAGRDCAASLKQLFQEHAVPPWLRGRLPLLEAAGQLVAVADLWVCAGFEAAPEEPSWQLHWERY